LLAALDKDDRVIVLDVAGQSWTSLQLAQFVGRHLRNDPRRLTFVIGGYGGIGEKVKARSERRWSLSPLTFTHEMTRVLVVEQLYRALCILNNHPYSK
jgi:23S rRNA (pseudouridine1915-N3)-methyltransferase